MVDNIAAVSLSTVTTALKNFGSTVAKMVHNKGILKDHSSKTGDEFKRSDSESRSPEEQRDAAIVKSNEANKERLVAEINRSGEIDSVYDKLLPEYNAYKNPNFKDLEFKPISANTVTAMIKGKQLEVKCKALSDNSKQYEICFDDNSQINYVTFSEGGKMKINGEEYEMPAGAITETKSVSGRVFSQLIQTPDMERSIITKPEYLQMAEQVLKSYNPFQA